MMISVTRFKKFISDDPARKITIRIVGSGVLFGALIVLSGIAFYYFYAAASIIPLILTIVAALPGAIMFGSLYDLHLLKLKQTH